MKKTVLFVGSDPADSEIRAKRIDADIENKAVSSVYEDRQYFNYESDILCNWLSFVTLMEKHQPSIVHISAHGEKNAEGEECILFTEPDTGTYAADAKQIIGVLGKCPHLELVYLDACNSEEIAKQLAKHVDFAVGFNGDIGVNASTRGSGIFHSRIAAGKSVEAATTSASEFVKTAYPRGVFQVLHRRDEVKDRTIRVMPRIIARFFKDDPSRDSADLHTINFGLFLNDRASPRLEHDERYLISIFSSDDSYVEGEYVTLIHDYPKADRSIWHKTPSRECWDCDANSRIFCTYTSSDGRFMETLTSKVADALDLGYEGFAFKSSDHEQSIRDAIQALRS